MRLHSRPDRHRRRAPLRCHLFGFGGLRLDRDLMPALQAFARRLSRGLGLDLFHPDEAAAGAWHDDRLVPGGIIAVRVAQATVERPSPFGSPFGEIAHAALGTLDADRDGLCVLALGVAGAREEFAIAAGLDDHRRAAFLADLVPGPIGNFVLLDGARVVALLRGVARAGDVGAEAAALHLERRATLGALLLLEAREIVYFVDDLVHIHGFECDAERLPEIAQDILPGEVALFDLVELGLHLRRKAHLEYFRERALEDFPDRFALWRGMEAAVFRRRVPAHAQRRDDGRVC